MTAQLDSDCACENNINFIILDDLCQLCIATLLKITVECVVPPKKYLFEYFILLQRIFCYEEAGYW